MHAFNIYSRNIYIVKVLYVFYLFMVETFMTDAAGGTGYAHLLRAHDIIVVIVIH